MAPGFDHLVGLVQRRVDVFVGGVGQQVPLAAGIRCGPLRGQPGRLVGQQPRVGLAQPLSDFGGAGVGPQAGRRLQLVEPLQQALGCLLRLARRQAEAFEVDQAPHARGAHAGIAHRHIAAHAVAEQVDRLGRRQVVDQCVEIAQVVREPIAVAAARAAAAEAAPVGRDDPAALAFTRGHGIDHELKRRADIHPAVKAQQERRQGRGQRLLPPLEQVVRQAAHGYEAAGRGAPRRVGQGHGLHCRAARAVGDATAR